MAVSAAADALPAGEPKATAPRSYFSLDGLDLVLVAMPARLFVFIDRADTNGPVDVDDIEVRSGNRRWALDHEGPGFYRGDAELGTGHVPLVVHLESAGHGGTVEGSIDIPVPAVAPPEHERPWWWWAAGAGAAVLILAAGWSAWRPIGRMFGAGKASDEAASRGGASRAAENETATPEPRNVVPFTTEEGRA